MNNVKAQADALPAGLLAGGAAEDSEYPEETKARIARILKSPNAYLAAAFVIAFSVLLIIPMWAFYGVLLPDEGAHGGHGGGETLRASEFEERTARFVEERRLPDGSVRADHGKPIYVVATQYTFKPDTIRLTAGEEYELKMLSTDVVHAFSIQMGNTSYNAVVMPKAVTALKLKPTQPGKYLVVCSEYCGIGHDYMYFSIVVEEGEGERDHAQMSKEQHEKMSTEQHEKTGTTTKGQGHGGH